MSIFSSLDREQKEAVGLLQIGTFLECFDLMLYVHMAVLLNAIFFAPTDSQSIGLLSAISFCSTFIFRPFGALIFGWIGDNVGRKATVILTTLMMAFSCIVMAILPPYSQIGIAASWIVTICRIVQGMSCMGERIGSELYLTEITKPPAQYPIVAIIGVCGTLGMTTALGVASLVTSYGLNWRYAFWFGVVVALIGSIARTRLRETPEFIDAKRLIKEALKNTNTDINLLNSNPIWQEKVNKKTAIAYFLMQCVWPVWFYLAYIHCGNLLIDSFGYSSEEVISNNFIVSIVELIANITLAYLSYKIYPLKILRILATIFLVFVLVCPILLDNITTPFQLLLFQLFIVMFAPTDFPAVAIFYKKFPVFKRFTYTSFTYALSRAVMYIITSFGLVYLIKYLGTWGLQIIILPVIIGYIFGLWHFIKLETDTRKNFIDSIH